MKRQAIIEIEEGALTLTLGASEGRSISILQCDRFSLAEATRENVTNVLRTLGSDPFQGAEGVHVVIGDRRAHHFITTVPKMSTNEVIQFVIREGLRVTGIASRDELLISPRLLRKLPGGRVAVAASALPTAVWAPLRASFKTCGIDIRSVHTMESCLAMAVPQGECEGAVLECSSGRARFVLCDSGAPVQVRRFILGGGTDGGSEALLMQLAMELPRTFDWLRETGHAEPKTLVLGNRLAFQEGSTEIDMLRGDLEAISRPSVDYTVAEDVEQPGLATLMLLHKLAASDVPRSLLAEPSIIVPWSAGKIVTLAATLAIGTATSWFTVSHGRQFLRIDDAVSQTESRVLEMQQRLAAAQAAAMPIGETAEAGADRLDLALSMRRPISRLAAEVSNCANDEVHIEQLQFASTDKVTVTGPT